MKLFKICLCLGPSIALLMIGWNPDPENRCLCQVNERDIHRPVAMIEVAPAAKNGCTSLISIPARFRCHTTNEQDQKLHAKRRPGPI